MVSSAPASPRGTPQGIGFGDRSPSSQRRSKLRRRSSSSDSSSSSEKDPKPSTPRKQSSGVENPHNDGGGDEQSKKAKEERQVKVTLSPTLQKLTRSIKTMVDRSKAVEKKPVEEKQNKEEVDQADDVNDRERERSSLPPRLSVAALIRSFSPRSRAKANKAEAAMEPKEDTVNPAEDGTPANGEQKTESQKKTRITFSTLKRASLSFPASPPSEPRRASHASIPSSAGPDTPVLVPPPPPPTRAILPAPLKPTATSTVSKWKQSVNAVPKDPPQLKIQIPPSPPIPPRLSLPPVSAVVEDETFATGPGSLVDDVRSTLAQLVELLDGVNPRKLLAIRLGGELRGLLGKAADEVEAYAAAFRDHARASVGVAIALQNLAASLQQVFPIVEKLRTAKFMLNRQFKRDVTFAFQEINSYYTSLFMELSMAVAMRAGVVLPMPVQVAPRPLRQEEEEEEEEEVKPEENEKAATPIPLAPKELAGEELCLSAHRHFFGHACPIDLPRALALYQQAAAQHCAVAMRCLGHMYMLGKGVEKDLFVAEHWLTQAAAASTEGDVEAWYLLGCLMCEKAPHEKSAALTRECLIRAQNHFTLAAERGLADAQYRLAELLERRDNQDDGYRDRILAALPWYRRAAEQRHTKAEATLGRLLLLLYDHDSLNQENLGHAAEAIHWLQRAAAADEHAEALTLLGAVFSCGRQGAKLDVDRGVAFLRRAVRAGSHEAMLRLAKLLLSPPVNGSSISSAVTMQDREESHDEALRLLLIAAQCSAVQAEADFEVGELLYHSRLLRDRTAALRFYLRAAQSTPTPHAVAARRAATMVYAGIGCKQLDKREAHRLYKIAADAGDAEALNALGLMYEDGEGCDLNFQQAAGCYRRAVELGSAHAHFNLGCLLAHGKGVPRNLDAAQAHFSKAVSLGYALARDFLRHET